MKTVKTGDGRSVPLIVKQVFPTGFDYNKISKFTPGDKVHVYQPYGGYNGTPDYKEGIVKSISLVRTGHHKFTDEGCEIYEQMALTVDFGNDHEGSYFEAYPYPIKKVE